MTTTTTTTIPKQRRLHWWTAEDDDYIRRHYQNTNASADEIGRHFGTSGNAVRQRAGRLALLRDNKTKWTPKELRLLHRIGTRYTAVTLSKMMGKSPNAILHKKRRSEIFDRDRDGWFTLSDVAKLFGADSGWVLRRIRNGKPLPIEPLKLDVPPPHKHGFDCWRIRESDLRDWIRRYPSELTGRKVDFILLVDILSGVLH